MLSFLSAAAVAACQPLKERAQNTIDSVLMTLMGIYFVSYHAKLTLHHKGYGVALAFQVFSITSILRPYSSGGRRAGNYGS
jgi:hypothetical protein